MRKLLTAACTLALALGFVLPVHAVGEDGFVPSVVQEGIQPDGDGVITDANGNETGRVPVVLGDKPIKDPNEPLIIVTPEEDCEKFVGDYDQNSSDTQIKDKLREPLENGIEYNSGAATVLLQDAVIESGSTSAFLNEFGEEAVSAANQQAVAPLDEYQPLTVFDVSCTDSAQQMVGGNNVTITLSIPGVDADKDLIVLGFKGDMDSLSQYALVNVTGQDALNAVKNMSVRAIPYYINEKGELVITLPYFCQIMIFVRDKKISPDRPNKPGQNTESGTTSSENTNTSANTNHEFWLAVFSGSVILLLILLVQRRRFVK